MDDAIDLFGFPIRPGYGRRGKPPHVPTPEDRNRVKALLALDWSEDRIAAVLGICKKTLRKHYLPELKCRLIAKDALEASLLDVLIRESQAGRVTAIDRLNRLLDKHAAEAVERRIRDRGAHHDEDEDPKPRRERKGKKEVDEEAAIRAEQDLAGRYGGLH
jgi:hypothetical protein